MQFKLIVAFVDDAVTDDVMKGARMAGATGATIINNARGEGVKRQRTFFGMQLETQRDVLLFVVEDAVGVAHQVERLKGKIEEEL